MASGDVVDLLNGVMFVQVGTCVWWNCRLSQTLVFNVMQVGVQQLSDQGAIFGLVGNGFSKLGFHTPAQINKTGVNSRLPVIRQKVNPCR